MEVLIEGFSGGPMSFERVIRHLPTVPLETADSVAFRVDQGITGKSG
jgi:hypothetical protein